MPLNFFTIRLGHAYYDEGFINPGIDVDYYFGVDGEPVTVRFSPPIGGNAAVQTEIDRNANQNKSARLHPRVTIRDWFRANFVKGDLVLALIMNRNDVMLLAPGAWKASKNARILPVSRVCNNEQWWKRLLKRIELLIQAGYPIGAIVFRGGGTLQIPDWFRKLCDKLGIKIIILEPDVYDRDYGTDNPRLNADQG